MIFSMDPKFNLKPLFPPPKMLSICEMGELFKKMGIEYLLKHQH
jgi:hypothetical protein